MLVPAATTLAQNACTKAGVDPSCCEQVCAINPLCCDIAWDAKCEALLAAANCLCAGAVPVTGTEVAIDTTAATADFNMAGVCDPGPYGDDVVHNLIVFSWSPKVQGRYTLSTCNIADFDTRLAVISTCDGATVVGCNDDATGCANFTSELTVDVDAGQEYYILVGGYSEADVGTGTMTITPFEVELTLQGAHRWEKSAGGNGKWYAKYAVNAGSTWEQIRTKAESMGGTLACANVASENTLLGSIYQATGSGARTAFGLYQDLTDPAYAEPLGGWKWVDGGALGYSTWANGEPNDFNGVEHYGQFVAYYFGEFWNDNYDTNAWTHVLVEFAKAQPGFTAPPNDEPAGATPLAAEQVVTVSLVGATTSATELVCEDPLFYDRWYTFTPAATDSYDIVGCGNGFDGSVAIYDSASNLVGCSGGVCTLQLSLTGGQTYLVRIGSPAGDSAGNPTISIAPSPDIVSLDAISVNFVGGTYIDGADGGRCNNSATTPVGANAWGTLNWSNLVGASDGAAAGYAANGNGDAPTALRDGYGEATTAAVSFTVNNPWRIYSFPANDTDRMRRGYLDSNTLSAINVTVSGVPYANYAVVVYFGADGPDRVGSVSANGSAPVYFKTDALPGSVFNPLVRATAADQASAVRSSYAVIEGLSGATCAISLAEFGPNVGFNGFQIIKTSEPCPSDRNGDGITDAADLAALLAQWGSASGDLNGDGNTDAADLAALLAAWGACS
jgi:hypothetical protein